MKTIAYICPYFGKFGKGFSAWLKSCEFNPTIDWIILTDNKTKYNYPKNVKVIYTTFEEVKKRIQSFFDFEISLDRPWKMCEYRPAYGQIFGDYLKKYDFWGHCDMDLIFGDIRKFITDDLLSKFDKIGFQGHSTLYKNNDEVNLRFRTLVPGKLSYKTAFTNSKGYCFDENAMEEIYKYLNIPYYNCVNFAHLRKYDYNFFLGHKPDSEAYKNERQVFVWQEGKLLRYYLEKDGSIQNEEYMYLHFWCRPMTYKIKNLSKSYFFIYSDVLTDKYYNITEKVIKKYGKKHPFQFYLKAFWKNKKKITIKKIIWNLKNKKKVERGK